MLKVESPAHPPAAWEDAKSSAEFSRVFTNCGMEDPGILIGLSPCLFRLESFLAEAETLALDITRENVLERLAIAVEFDLMDLYNHAFNLLLFSGQLLEVSKSPDMQRFPHLMQHMLLQLAVVRLSG